MTTAEEFKAKGNAALQANKLSEAIAHYTSAINADGSNHVYYSNRSAAYLKKGEAQNALDDAVACVGLNPEFAKGYSRKGAALHALKRYNDSMEAYEEGLAKFPNDAGLKNGLDQVKKDRDGPPAPSFSGPPPGAGGNPMGGLFGPDMMAQIALNPKLRHHLSDADFMAKIKLLQADPNQLPNMLSDPRIMEVFRTMLGAEGIDVQTTRDAPTPPDREPTTAPPSSSSSPAAKSEPAKEEPMEVEEEEVEEDLTPEELKQRQDAKDAVKAKERGNDLYKNKKFEEALAAYDEAIALDPTNMTFHNNKAAVYFTRKKYDECIAACEKAIEVGNEHKAPFEDRAKAWTRCAKAYEKKGDLSKAIHACKQSLLESHDKATERMLKNLELEKRKADALSYQDEEKAEEAKQRGNEFFRNQQFGDAVREYEEAVKRAPRNAPIRNNLSAALTKVMDISGAKRHIEVALEIDPKYVKAWARKGDTEMLMKEYHKAMESYKKGLELDPENASCREGYRKVMTLINTTTSAEDQKERAAHALADPEIQNILQDPVINQVLKDFGENPKAANEAMADPTVRGKIEKLIAAGIVQTA